MSIFEYIRSSLKPENTVYNTGLNETSLQSMENSDKYLDYFNNAPLGMAAFNSDGALTEFNDMFLTILSVDRRTMDGFSLFSLDDPNLSAAVKSTLEGNNSRFEGYYKSVFEKKTIPLKANISPIKQSGITVGGIAIFEDISFKKQLERIFFHDILNSGGNLRNLAEILDGPSLDDEIKQRLIKRIYNQSDRLIEDIKLQRYLLAYNASEIKPALQKINSLELINSRLTIFINSEFIDSQIIEIDNNCLNIDFLGNKLLLGKIIDQMIKNAISATNAGEKIFLSCSGSPDTITFSVQNPGSIAEEIKSKLFSQELKNQNGENGLGTYKIKYLCDKFLNGSVSFTSSEESGTRFTITVPYKTEAGLY